MNFENQDLYSSDTDESTRDVVQSTEVDQLGETGDLPAEIHASFSPALLGYAAYKLMELPVIKEKINECKEAVGDFFETVGDNIKEFTAGVYDSVKEFFTGSESADTKAFSMYSKEFTETREFGLDHCVEAAKELFNPGVISEWANLTYDERAQICYLYADEVAKAFELENYKGVIFEEMEPGTLGSNCGDGYIHLSMELLHPIQTPLNLIDTITHELRHQYQSECVNGAHDVADEVRNEWSVATQIYTTDPAWCYDPWGYIYNPLEIDSRYAGETVVRGLTSDMFNDILAQA